jgi:hypothetical protein
MIRLFAKWALIALFASVHLLTPATAQTVVQVTDSFVEYRLKSFNRTRPGLVIRWQTRVIGGEIAICGVMTYPEFEQRSRLRSRVKRGTITYEGQVIMKNLFFFSEVGREAQLATGQANCRSTGVAAPNAEYTVFIKI